MDDPGLGSLCVRWVSKKREQCKHHKTPRNCNILIILRICPPKKAYLHLKGTFTSLIQMNVIILGISDGYQRENVKLRETD